MGHSTASTIWPTLHPNPVSPAVHSLLDRFFTTLDSPAADAGDVLADDVFCGSAVAQFGLQIFHGREGACLPPLPRVISPSIRSDFSYPDCPPALPPTKSATQADLRRKRDKKF
jgi:hypothetical protein